MLLQRALVFILLFVIWFILSGNTHLDHLVMGAICCGLVTWMSGDLMFRDRERALGEKLKVFGRFLAYIPWLAREIVIANVHVLRLTLSPSGLKHVRPRIVRYQTYLKSDFARFLLANSITLTPGTITVILEGDELFIHAISEKTEKGLSGPMEAKIARVFGEEKTES